MNIVLSMQTSLANNRRKNSN